MTQNKGVDIQERLISFAANIIQLSESLPNTRAGKRLADQVLRSGTAPAAHHAEARGAESANDFIHKLKIAVKELNETEVWLRIIEKAKLLDRSALETTLDECKQLGRILAASIRTTRNKMKN